MTTITRRGNAGGSDAACVEGDFSLGTSTDQIAKYDSIAGKWTVFDLPTRGTESRYISILEKDGKLQVVVPYSRTRKVAVMSVRSEGEMQALKTRAEGQ